jgi:hypothetical protein
MHVGKRLWCYRSIYVGWWLRDVTLWGGRYSCRGPNSSQIEVVECVNMKVVESRMGILNYGEVCRSCRFWVAEVSNEGNVID